MVSAVALTATVAEQTNYINFPWNCGSRNHCSDSQWQNIFYTCSTQPHTADDKVKVLLLPYTAKLQVMRKMMPPTVIYLLSLWTLYIDNTIAQFRYIKIQPKTIDLSTRLVGITTEFVGFIPTSLVLRSIVLG